MKKLLKFSYACTTLYSLLLLSSCDNLLHLGVDIYERAHFHENGAGKFSISIDLRKFHPLINIAQNINQDSTLSYPLMMSDIFLNAKRHLKHVPGIHQVAIAHDGTLLYYRLTFYFANINALNEAMHRIYKNVTPCRIMYFKMDENFFERKDPKAIQFVINHYYKKNDDSFVHSFNLNFFLKKSTYTTLYSFDKPIQKATNRLSSASKNRKALIIKHRMIEGKTSQMAMDNQLFF